MPNVVTKLLKKKKEDSSTIATPEDINIRELVKLSSQLQLNGFGETLRRGLIKAKEEGLATSSAWGQAEWIAEYGEPKQIHPTK